MCVCVCISACLFSLFFVGEQKHHHGGAFHINPMSKFGHHHPQSLLCLLRDESNVNKKSQSDNSPPALYGSQGTPMTEVSADDL